jgi:uncharacterized protein (DUF2336 family)
MPRARPYRGGIPWSFLLCKFSDSPTCIAIKGQEYLFAIATRNKVSETISDRLIAKGNTKVLGTLASNPGAAISDPSFAILVRRSVSDDRLSECVPEEKTSPSITFASCCPRRQRLCGND